jgi:uncharacterized protein YegP (UPF0339 family)
LNEQWMTSNGDQVHVFQDRHGDWRWHVRAGNGEIVGQGESHPERSSAVAAAERHHPRVEDGE